MFNNHFSRFAFAFFSFFLTATFIHAQVVFWTDNFDAGSPTSGARTPENNGGTGGPPFASYFCMTPATGTVNQAVAFTGHSGNYWAGEDHNNPALSWAGTDGRTVREQQIEWTGINISGKSTLSFRGLFAANQASDAWDNKNACLGGASTNTDYVILQYKIDAGSYTDLVHFFSKGAFTDKDLYEDTAYPVPDSCGDGIMLTEAFQEFTKSIPGTGTSLSLRLLVYSENSNEEWGIENLRLYEVAAGPEINVQGNSTTIVDGDATPSLTDHTDFGSVGVCSATLDRTFTIQNTGSSSLSITSAVLSGAASGDYSIFSAPASSVAAGGSTTVVVRFNPTATGARNATLTINNSDTDEAAYDFAITGTGIEPEINVQGNSTTIVDGDITPTTTDHTDFGSISTCFVTFSCTFTIQNTGTTTLNITTSTITGAAAGDYTITSAPASTVAAGGSTTIQVAFAPSALGARNATLTINNSDCDEAVYNFSITGTGIDPEIDVQGNSTSIADGDVTPSLTDHTDFGTTDVCAGTIVRTFTILNTGTSNLSVTSVTITGAASSDYSVTTAPASSVVAAGSTTFQVTFNPTAAGLRSATITVANSDCNEATYDFAVQGTGADPEMGVSGNSVAITDGDVSPSLTDFTDFGSVGVCSATQTRTFVISNSGTATLNVTGISITGSGAADYSVTTAPASTVAAAGTTSFVVTFNPSVTGLRSASISIANSDCNENPYDYAIQGTGVEPEANIQGNSTTIVDGDATPSLTDHTDFGSAGVCVGTVVRTFTVQNTGTTTLSVTGVTFTGAAAADYSLTAAPAATVAAAGSTTFQVTFNPSAGGTRSATVNVATSDCDEATYDFAVQGVGNDPEINLVGNSTTITDGDVTPTTTDHTDFGNQRVCTGTIARTFTIQNTGTLTLNISGAALSGAAAADYTVTTPPAATVAPAGSTTVVVTFNPSVNGLRSATLTITNDDCDEGTYDFAIQGTGIDPEANMLGNSLTIADGDITPSSSDHTDFGTAYVCTGTIARTFTLQNTGNTVLNITSTTITGAGAIDYTVTSALPSTIAAGSSAPFTVTFDPSIGGARAATITVNTDDCDEGAYDFAITGNGDASVTSPGVISSPSDQTVCEGSNATFTASGSGGGLSYQWQENTGSGFVNITPGPSYSGINTATLTVIAATTGMSGYRYQCIISNPCGNVTTGFAVLTVQAKPSISAEPVPVSECEGKTASFSVTAGGAGVAYQWQVDMGSGFVNLTAGAPYSGVTFPILGISPVTAGMSGYLYRCIVSGTCAPNDTSLAVMLTVGVPPSISVQPVNDTVCEGDNALFTLTAGGTFNSFQWQENDGSGWVDLVSGGMYSGATTGTLDITGVTAGMDGYWYQCVVYNSCDTAVTDSVLLDVLMLPAIIGDPSDVSVCESSLATFTVVASGDALTYQWQEDAGSGFVDVVSGGIYSGATSPSLNILGATTGMSGYLYRCIVSGACNPPDTSAAATLTIFIPATVGLLLDPISCFGSMDGAIDQIMSGTPPFTYIWSTGATTEDLSPVGAGGYSCTITDGNGCILVTNYFLSEPPPLNTNGLVTQLACTDVSNGCIELTVNGGTPPYDFLWDTGDTAEDPCGLMGGPHSVVVTDANGCSDTLLFIVGTVPASPVTIVHAGDSLTATGGPFTTYQWYDGTGAPIGGATGMVYYYTISPDTFTYIVTVTDTNGCSSSDTISIIITQDGQADAMQQLIQLYPVPASGTAWLSPRVFIPGDTQLTLIQMNGAVLQRRTLRDWREPLALDLTKLSAGVYAVRIDTPNGVWVGRLVVE